MRVFLQGGACKNACQTQGPRGHACRDGAHSDRHPRRRAASACPMETEALKVIQRKETHTRVHLLLRLRYKG